MTRLEELANNVVNDLKWLDQTKHQEDAIATEVKNYLDARNDFIASKLTAEQAIIAQAAASEFDNVEVADSEADE
jgi:hypothetical protein